jgi:hypothetical protein
MICAGRFCGFWDSHKLRQFYGDSHRVDPQQLRAQHTG